MQALKTLVGTSQIVFGTDAPFFDGAPQVQGLQRAGFSADELRGVERDNALEPRPAIQIIDAPRAGTSAFAEALQTRRSRLTDPQDPPATALRNAARAHRPDARNAADARASACLGKSIGRISSGP